MKCQVNNKEQWAVECRIECRIWQVHLSVSPLTLSHFRDHKVHTHTNMTYSMTRTCTREAGFPTLSPLFSMRGRDEGDSRHAPSPSSWRKNRMHRKNKGEGDNYFPLVYHSFILVHTGGDWPAWQGWQAGWWMMTGHLELMFFRGTGFTILSKCLFGAQAIYYESHNYVSKIDRSNNVHTASEWYSPGSLGDGQDDLTNGQLFGCNSPLSLPLFFSTSRGQAKFMNLSLTA